MCRKYVGWSQAERMSYTWTDICSFSILLPLGHKTMKFYNGTVGNTGVRWSCPITLIV